MALTVEVVPSGPLETNSYVIVDLDQHLAFVIDAPPGSADMLVETVQQHQARAIALVITHTHWDHIGDAAVLRRRLGAPILAHRLAVPGLEQPRALIGELPFTIEPAPPDRTLSDGETLTLGTWTFQVIHTPGHAPEQLSLYQPDHGWLFCGDTLFQNGYGRVDLPGSSVEQTIATLRRLLTLPAETVVYPGHGGTTTIGRESGWIRQLVESTSAR